MATIHVFERAGLGKAPFKYVGMDVRRGPYTWTDKSGITITCGSPGQPMETCDFCGTSIAVCCHIASAAGKKFIVGSSCVAKTGDKGLRRAVNRDKRKAQVKREEAAVEAFKQTVVESRALLETLSPPAYSPAYSLVDYYDWMMENAGHSGRVRAMRVVKKALKEARQPEKVGERR